MPGRTSPMAQRAQPNHPVGRPACRGRERPRLQCPLPPAGREARRAGRVVRPSCRHSRPWLQPRSPCHGTDRTRHPVRIAQAFREIYTGVDDASRLFVQKPPVGFGGQSFPKRLVLRERSARRIPCSAVGTIIVQWIPTDLCSCFSKHLCRETCNCDKSAGRPIVDCHVRAFQNLLCCERQIAVFVALHAGSRKRAGGNTTPSILRVHNLQLWDAPQ